MDYRGLAGNMLVAFAAQGTSLLASFAMALLVPKVLGVEPYAYWQLFVFYVSYSGFFHFGLNDGVYLVEGGRTRNEVDKRAINSQFMVGLTFQLLFALVFSTASIAMAPETDRTFVLLAFAAYTVVYNMSGYLGYVFQAMNETKLFSFMTMLERGTFLVPMLVLIALRVGDFRPFVIFYIVSRSCSLAYCCWKARDFLHSGVMPPSTSLRLAIASVRVGFPLMVSNVAGMLIMGVARGLVDFAWGIEVFGEVSFSLSMVNFFMGFISQASMVMFPALRQGTEGERKGVYRALRDGLELALPCVYLLYFPIIWVLSAWLPQYAGSMGYFALLLPMCLFETKMSLCCTTYLKVLRRERLLLRINLVTLAASACASLAGIYALGSLEAVLIGVVACIACRSIWSEHYLDRELDIASTRMPLEEVGLSSLFVCSSLLLPWWGAQLVYAAAYALYLAANRRALSHMVGVAKRMLGRRRGGGN